MLDRQIGHYRLIEKLGAGGMGEVYRAEDCLLRRLVALKVLSPERSGQPRSLQRFQREARSVAALNHPNVVTIYSVEESEGLHFLTMELVEGKTLTEIIPPGGMSMRNLLDIAVPLIEGLGAAHECGIMHRDLKPDNIMVSREGRVKVLDFGIAKGTFDEDATRMEGRGEREETLTRTGLILGTPAYMAPEQIRGATVDHRADLFAFGVILFQMATGQRPFLGLGSSDVLAAILRDAPPRASSLNPRVPVELDELIGDCLEKDVSQRIRSASDVRERLQSLSAGLSAGPSTSRPPAEPVLVPSPAWHGWRRSAVLLTLAGGLVLALTVGWGRISYLSEISARPPATSSAEPGEISRPGLAVLPLGNFSNEPEYLVDGMTDYLISSLSEVRGVRTISRQSVMRYKGSSRSLPQIARELGVQLIVQGSVLRAGSRIRITAQLVRATPEQQLWAESYERDVSDILSLQKEVAEAITREIKVKLDPNDRRRLASDRLVDPQAYDAYLRGRYALNRRSRDSIIEALQSFQKALEIDPEFSLAHAGLAESFAWAGSEEAIPAARAFRLARQHAETALEIDPDQADALVALGHVQLWADHDWRGADASFRRAIALQPNHPTAHYLYWVLFYRQGRREQAYEQIRLAAELDPLSPIINVNLGLEAFLAGREEEALRLWKRVQTLDPEFMGVYHYLSGFYERKGNPDLGYQHYRTFLGLCCAEILPRVDRAYRANGREAALEAAAQGLQDLARRRLIAPDEVARVYVRLGQRDKALDWLEKAYEQGFPGVIFFRSDWGWESLHSEPRFQALIDRIG